jgi:hypothetical protein
LFAAAAAARLSRAATSGSCRWTRCRMNLSCVSLAPRERAGAPGCQHKQPHDIGNSWPATLHWIPASRAWIISRVSFDEARKSMRAARQALDLITRCRSGNSNVAPTESRTPALLQAAGDTSSEILPNAMDGPIPLSAVLRARLQTVARAKQPLEVTSASDESGTALLNTGAFERRRPRLVSEDNSARKEQMPS